MNPALPSISLNATADLSDRAIFQVSGPDAVHYLNGQVSQDVRLASDSEAVYSITATFKGKLEGDFYIRKFEGNILIDTDSSQSESLFMRLDKYLIADDAEIIDVSDQYSLAFSTGVIPAAIADAPQWKSVRFGIEGADYLLAKDTKIETTHSPDDWEQIRIINGVPAWNHELDSSVLPPEAGLDVTAVSYTKGCYTGQEVISRMKSSGKTNRHLIKLQCGKEIAVPTEFFAEIGDAKPAGTINSITKSDDQWIGLGYRTRKHEERTEFLTADGVAIKVC